MTQHFIYVFCKEAKEDLLKRGYVLISDNRRQNIYIFENKGENPFPDKRYDFVFSDTLSF